MLLGKHPTDPTEVEPSDDHLFFPIEDPFCVEQVMTTALVTVAPDTPVEDALTRAENEGVHHLLVVRGTRLHGIVCQYDLSQADESELVADCMSTSLACIDPEATLEEAAELMKEHAVGCLPVLQGGFLVGIVTRGDLRRAGLPADRVVAPACASCHGREHVRLDPRSGSVAFCLDCLERARPPVEGEEVGVGD